jgi:hypothetical protein
MKRSVRGNLKPTAGTAREQRFPLALAPEYARLDQRNCADQMAAALELAKLLAYYDESNQRVGDWSDFFRRDISFLLAQIATSNLQREGFQIGALQSAAREGRADIRQILHAIYRMTSRIDSWYLWSRELAEKNLVQNGSGSSTANDIFNKLEGVVRKLKGHLGMNLKGLLQDLAPMHGKEGWAGYWEGWESKLSKMWQPGSEFTEGGPTSLTPIAGVMDTSPLEGLLSVLRSFQEANLGLVDLAQQHMEGTLGDCSDHPPHTALYMAFARLLDLQREKINVLTGSHLDFYYHEVLRIREKGSTPDVVHLSFEAVPAITGFTLPAGTRLPAGKDPSGALREYATNADLYINQGRIAALKALYLTQDNYNTSAHEPDRVMSILRFPQCDSEDGLGAPLTNSASGWPTFGLNEMTTDATERLQQNTDIGFVLASSALLLREGERNVNISLAFEGESSLEQALERYRKVADDVLDQSPSIDELLADAFNISLSTEKGWLAVSASFRRHPVVGTAMEIEFALQPADPPVVANAVLSPEPQTPQWPLLKLSLNPLARIFAYSFFKDLTIKTIDIRVSVRGVKALQLYNQVGLLSVGQPFPVFGPTPAQGSYLLLSHPELAVKDVSHATINIVWFNLPRPPASLTSHYAAYNLGISDDSFKVRLSVYADGNRGWVNPSASNDVIPLFARDFDRSGLLTTTAMAVDIDQLTPPINDPATAGPATADQLTDSQAPRGTIRIELIEPEFGFGQTVYPQIMTNAATANARAGKNGSYTPIPNPPLAPVARSLTFDYEAADQLDLTRPLAEEGARRFYCIDSFGYTGHTGRAPSLLPQMGEQGHLYLGLVGIGPRQSLTLLFQISDSGYSRVPSLLHHQDEKPLLLKWRYLSNNEWKDYPETLLLSDSTMGLTRSGIVKFKLPEDITSGNTRMPGEFCWIHAAQPQVAGAYLCNVVSVDTQAVTATRIVTPESELVPLSLPAGSISQLSAKRPEIKSVRQPFASSGGRNREDVQAFRTRASERLRHKGRAVQPSDYERLILQEFPEVGQVKCITNNNSRVSFRTPAVPPGVIYLVATPRLEEHPEREPRLPRHVLKKITDFITPLASPMVKDIHVINPVYETLKVFVTVEFSVEGDDTGFADDLDEAISQYLLPWRQVPFKPMPIGSGQVQGYQLSKFIQEQCYVKQLHALKMLHTYQTENKQAGSEANGSNIDTVGRWLSDENRSWASGPWAVMLPAARHSIVSVAPGATPTEIEKGIYNLAVGSDFATKWSWKEEKKEKSTEPRYFLVMPRATVVKTARD